MTKKEAEEAIIPEEEIEETKEEQEEAKGKDGAQSPILTFLGSLSSTLASFFYEVDYYSLYRTFSSLLNNISYCDPD